MNKILISDEKPLNITEPIKPRVWVETEQIHSKVDRIIADRNEDTTDHNNEVSTHIPLGGRAASQRTQSSQLTAAAGRKSRHTTTHKTFSQLAFKLLFPSSYTASEHSHRTGIASTEREKLSQRETKGFHISAFRRRRPTFHSLCCCCYISNRLTELLLLTLIYIF